MKTEEYVLLGFMCLVLCFLHPTCKKDEPDQENLETIERQDEVIKTYQIAKMIFSGTAFESFQLTV